MAGRVGDPSAVRFMWGWPLYRAGEVVYVHDNLIIPDELSSPFDLERPWQSIPERTVVDEDGNAVSEWVTSMGEIRDFLAGRT
ncbi:hypothetical protein [Amycolatopsis suaedae]|uniref:hypothetical protein n=1 Tax=Amycolatopsis suaedae TaxID=2510978 RepID=UPI003B837FF6